MESAGSTEVPTKCHFLPLSNTRGPRALFLTCLCSPLGPPPCLQARPAVGPSPLSPEGLTLSGEHPSRWQPPSLTGLQFRAASFIPQLSPGLAVAPRSEAWGPGPPPSFTDTGPGKRKYLLTVTATAVTNFTGTDQLVLLDSPEAQESEGSLLVPRTVSSRFPEFALFWATARTVACSEWGPGDLSSCSSSATPWCVTLGRSLVPSTVNCNGWTTPSMVFISILYMTT